MASLLISAAINIAIGLAINALFPPPDIENEGPRLTDLQFTSAAYGRMVNVPFGTDRLSGNLIDTPDPAIEEVVTEETETFGDFFGFGGTDVTTTTYTYFLTARIAWGIEGATDIIRWWADGKIIADYSDTTLVLPILTQVISIVIKTGVFFIFYPGGADQLQDPEEVARRGSDVPAYGHLTSIKVDRMPLEDYGNRIPNFTAEIAYASSVSTPILNTIEPIGFDPPGSLAGGDLSYMSFNPDRNEVYGLKTTPTGIFSLAASSMQFKAFIGGDGASEPAVGTDGFAYFQTGATNAATLSKVDIETGETVATHGTSGLGLSDTFTSFGNNGQWWQLATALPGVGLKSTVFHFNTSFPVGGPPTGSVVDPDLIGVSPSAIIHLISTDDGLVDDGGPLKGTGIPDHDRGRFFIFQNDNLNDEYRLVQYTPEFIIGGGIPVPGSVGLTAQLAGVDTKLVRRFTRGTFAGGDDFEGTGEPAGWAVDRANGNLILSNNTCVVLYNPDTDTILAKETSAGMKGRNNYYSNSVIAWGISSITNGIIRVIDTRTLKIIRDTNTDDLPWPSGIDGVIHETSCVWDDRTQSLMLSRVGVSSTAATDFRVLKLFVNRITALGVGLDTVVLALSTSYKRQKMAGLLPADVDVSTLAGDNVPGFTLNQPSTMKGALQPLRNRFQFDAHQSDWKIKFPKRGAVPTVTIPEEDVGILKRGRTQTEEPAVVEIRLDDLSLPMSLAVRYRNKDSDYQVDVERDKRHLFPNPTMWSRTEKTIDIPMVETATNMKQLAQKTLLTMWNERVSYKTIIPWTYMKLDSTDVFNMGVFNETHQLRMAENDLGQGWSIEITGVVEDTKSFTSTLAGGLHQGHINQIVPSGLPTRLFPMDAPLLSIQDLLFIPLSAAYMAVGAFEDGWRGASVQKSVDGVTYFNTGAASQEAASARVRVAPGAWPLVNGEFPNRWQEIADGGSMTITPLRRSDAWASTTEALLLSGANHLVVIRGSGGPVEVIGFQDAALNDDNTVDLTRLLRGRYGTEDITDLGISAGDTCILISSATKVLEAGAILRQSLPLSELNSVLFFRGVTVGVLPEDAPIISATYTGRDLQPYYPANIRATGDGLGGLDVVWARRARGPLAAEWIDGTGTVILNEGIEQYEVTLSTPGVPDFITKTVDDIELVNFTAAEVALGGGAVSFAQAPWPAPSAVDGDFEGGTTDVLDQPLTDGNWVDIDSPTGWYWRTTGSGSIPGPSGDGRISPPSTTYLNYVNSTSDTQRTIRNTIDLVADVGLSSDQISRSVAKVNIWCAQSDNDDSCDVWLHVLDAADNILATVSHLGFKIDPSDSGVALTEWISVGTLNDASADPWPQRSMTLGLDLTGAAKLAFDVGINKGGTTFNNGHMAWDHLELEVVTIPADITVKIVQVSETGFNSPIGFKKVT